MTDHKIVGCCSLCDKPCFEVLEMGESGEPKRLGQPLPEAARIDFLLYDGTKTSLTFCGECADISLAPHFIEIWAKVIRSWQRELNGNNPEWYLRQFDNGLLCEIGRKTWKVLANG